MHIVYVIESERKNGWYIGYTTNLRQRLSFHNTNRNISTKNKGLWRLIYCEAYLEKMDALGREKFLKSGTGRTVLKKQMRYYLGRKTALEK